MAGTEYYNYKIIMTVILHDLKYSIVQTNNYSKWIHLVTKFYKFLSSHLLL